MIKSVQQGGHLAWSNLKQNSCCFATGGFSGSDAGVLRLHQFDPATKTLNSNLLGWSQVQAPFTSLAWDNFQQESQTYQQGILAGGLSDGSVAFFDPQLVIEQYDQQQEGNGVLAIIDAIYEGPVNTMEFNIYKNNLLALGGQDVLVMNIERDIVQPQIFSPGNPNLHENHSITSVSWNRKVPHILASASQNGLTVVWDLKINKSVFSFQDSSAVLNRKVSLSWNPEIATQIAVTYDDERVPELQIWDLRNPQGPVVVFNQTHQEGINCLSWCTQDNSLILTGGRDRQIVCWNYKTQEVVSQQYVDFDILDLKWSSKVPSIYGVVGADGHTEVRTMEGANEIGYAPRWYKPPVAARFSPNGTLACFRENTGNQIQILNPTNIQSDLELDSFDKFIEAQDIVQRVEMECSRYAQGELDSDIEFEAELWRIMKALNTVDISDYLSTLGFNKRDITSQTENYTGKRHKRAEEKEKTTQQSKPTNSRTYDFATMSAQDAESFFDQFANQSIQKENASTSQKNKKSESQSQTGKEIIVMEQVSKNTNWDTGVEKIIKDNLIIGNYNGAIDCALKCGRSAEALLLAHSQGTECFESTVNQFLTAQTDYFLKNVFKNVVSKQWEEITKSYNLNEWKECIAIVISSCEDQTRVNKILQQLGDRFLTEKKDTQNALLCFTLARNASRSIPLYAQLIKQNQNTRSSTYQSQLVRALKYSIAMQQVALDQVGADVSKPFADTALRLAYCALSKQRPLTAYHALAQAPQVKKVQQLMDLLYNQPSNEQIKEFYDPPTFPYKRENVNTKLKIEQTVQQRKQIFTAHENPHRAQTSETVKNKQQTTQQIAPPVQQKKSPFQGQTPPPPPPVQQQQPPPIASTGTQPVVQQQPVRRPNPPPPPPVAQMIQQQQPNLINNPPPLVKEQISPPVQQQNKNQITPVQQQVKPPPPVIARQTPPPPPVQQQQNKQPFPQTLITQTQQQQATRPQVPPPPIQQRTIPQQTPQTQAFVQPPPPKPNIPPPPRR